MNINSLSLQHNNINTEYQNYVLSMLIRQRCTVADTYETRNILKSLESWLISSAQNGKFMQNLNVKELRKNIDYYKIAAVDDIVPAIEFIIKFHQNNLSENSDKIIITTDTIFYNHFKFRIDPERLTRLKELCGGDEKIDTLHQCVDVKIAMMALRYATINIMDGNQLAIPPKIYQYLIDHYDADTEGFASPLNSQLIMLRSQGENSCTSAVFCSLFPDVDAPFGSIGSFFNADFHARRCIVANPPFILEIMNLTMTRITALCHADPAIIIILCVPSWVDAPYYQRARSSPYLRDWHDFPRFDWWNFATSTIIHAAFPVTFFVFSQRNLLSSIRDIY